MTFFQNCYVDQTITEPYSTTTKIDDVSNFQEMTLIGVGGGILSIKDAFHWCAVLLVYPT